MQRSQPRNLSPFQFPLRSLFVFTLVVAIVSGLVRILPPGLWYLLIFPTLPILGLSASILGVIYLRAAWRAFWLGFGISLIQVMLLAFMFEGLGGRWMGEWEALLLIPIFVVVVPVLSGLIGVFFFRAGEANKPPSTMPVASEARTGGERDV